MTPVTTTDFPVPSETFFADPSGIKDRTSFDPDTRRTVFPPASLIVPATEASESFIVKPFFEIASLSCLKVTEFPGFIFTTARPFSRLTSTESTPGTAFKDTRTACAQTSQSIPKIVMSMDLISADAANASIKTVESVASVFLISSS